MWLTVTSEPPCPIYREEAGCDPAECLSISWVLLQQLLSGVSWTCELVLCGRGGHHLGLGWLQVLPSGVSAGCLCAAGITWEIIPWAYSGSKYKNKPKFLQFSPKLAASFPRVFLNAPSGSSFPQSRGFILLLSQVINGTGNFPSCFPCKKQEWALLEVKHICGKGLWL